MSNQVQLADGTATHMGEGVFVSQQRDDDEYLLAAVPAGLAQQLGPAGQRRRVEGPGRVRAGGGADAELAEHDAGWLVAAQHERALAHVGDELPEAVTQAVRASHPGVPIVPDMAPYATDGSIFRGAGAAGTSAVRSSRASSSAHCTERRVMLLVRRAAAASW